MKFSHCLLFAGLLLYTACTPASSGVPAKNGRVQRIFEGPNSAELMEISFSRFNEKGLKVELKYLDTHQRFIYDARDSLLQVLDLDAGGNETKAETSTYDDQGYILADSFFSGSTLTLVVQYAYDAERNLISKTSRSKYGGETRHTYHYENQRRKGETRTESNASPTEIQYSYDGQGRIAKLDYKSQDPQSRYSETFYYDAAGRLSNKEERVGETQEISYKRYWAYDPQGRLVETFCNPEDGKGCQGKIVFTYNEMGDLVSEQEFVADSLISIKEYRWE